MNLSFWILVLNQEWTFHLGFLLAAQRWACQTQGISPGFQVEGRLGYGETEDSARSDANQFCLNQTASKTVSGSTDPRGKRTERIKRSLAPNHCPASHTHKSPPPASTRLGGRAPTPRACSSRARMRLLGSCLFLVVPSSLLVVDPNAGHPSHGFHSALLTLRPVFSRRAFSRSFRRNASSSNRPTAAAGAAILPANPLLFACIPLRRPNEYMTLTANPETKNERAGSLGSQSMLSCYRMARPLPPLQLV